jgi:hypothetical protein
MSHKTIIECDRCGVSESVCNAFTQPGEPGWVEIIHLGKAMHFCPTCADAFKDWLDAPGHIHMEIIP